MSASETDSKNKIDDKRSKLAKMSQDNIIKAVLILAWPVIIEMLLHSSVGIADTAMVGRLGPASIAAIGLSNQILMFAFTLFAAVRTGATVLVARLVGAGDHPAAANAARQALLMGITVALGVALLGIMFPEAALRFIGAEPEVIEVGVGYMRWRSLGMIFAISTMTVTSILRGLGDTLTAMYVNASVNILNIFLNWIFIFGKFGMPQMDAAGAGFATMLARSLGAVAMLWILTSGKSELRVPLKGMFKVHWDTIKRMLNIGVPAAIEQGFMRGAMIAFTMIVAGLGTNTYAAHQVAIRADSVAFMPGFGFSVAATTLVGQNLGAKQPDEAKRAGNITMYLAIALMSSVGVLLFFFATPVMRFFTNEIEVIETGARVLRIMAFALPFMAVARVSAGALRGAGDTTYVMWGTGLSIWGARLGLAFFFVKILGWGLTGAWLGMCADHVARAAIFYFRWYQGKWTDIKV